MLQLAIAIGVFGIIVAGVSLAMIRRLTARFDAALGQQSEGSLETLLKGHMSEIATVHRKLDRLTEEYERLSASASLASQKISLVRFNPFGDTGGDQSFCLAVLDAHDSGYVLTSIHGREGTRVYVKPIDFRKSKYTLSEEEQLALAQAAKRVPTADTNRPEIKED